MEGGEAAGYAYGAEPYNAPADGAPADPADGAGAGAGAVGGADGEAAAALVVPKEVAQPVWLLAFNRFAAERRRELRAENETRSGAEAERLIGNQWRAMSTDQKQVYMQRAEEERSRIVATQFGGVEPARPPRKKSVKAEAGAEEGGEAGASAEAPAAPKPGGKKRGRPPKTAYMAGAGAVPNFAPNAAAFNNGAGGAAHGSLVGSRVEGIVDGAFDVGYFLTVRVAGSNQLMRALIFRPELCVGGQLIAAPPAAMAPAVPETGDATM